MPTSTAHHIENILNTNTGTNPFTQNGTFFNPVFISNTTDPPAANGNNEDLYPSVGGSKLGHTVAVYACIRMPELYPDCTTVRVAWGFKVTGNATFSDFHIGETYLRFLDGETGNMYIEGFTSITPRPVIIEEDGLSLGVIIGISIGAAVLGGLLVRLIIYYTKKETKVFYTAVPMTSVGSLIRNILP
jgi:hypothetical protein